jgi:hypothetical protein
LLDPTDFYAFSRGRNAITYWLRVDDVLKGLPGQERVPMGHWQRLVELARDVAFASAGSNQCISHHNSEEDLHAQSRIVEQRFIVGWCGVDELMGGL